LVLLAATASFGQCVVPQYGTGKVWEDSKSTIDMAISLRLSDFAPMKLVCLATALKQSYRDRTSITILIFSSADAAKYYMPGPPIGDYGPPANAEQARIRKATWSADQLHALYSYDAGKREEYVVLKPRGFHSDQPEDTRIPLPVIGILHCRLEVAGRCLLALDQVVYADGAYETKIAASRTLAATVTRDGEVTGIQVADDSGALSPPTDLFARAAANNLKTWILEPSPRQNTFRITYSFVIDSSLQRGQSLVQYALPNQITVRANP
jgi:hypothetical protein